MLTNNDNCNNPAQNLVYVSEACFYSQGRALQNATNLGTSGIGVFNGKFNDLIGLRNLAPADASVLLTLDTINKLINFNVRISATPGNTLTLNLDGLYSAGGGGGGDTLSPLLLMGG